MEIHAASGKIKPLKIWGLRQIRVPDLRFALFAFLGVILIGSWPESSSGWS